MATPSCLSAAWCAESDGGKHSGYLNIPFGSCGNLQSLGVSGSHSRSSFGRNSRPRTLSCAECTAAARAAKQAAIEQAEDAAAASARAVAATAETGSAVADSSQAGLGPWNCASCGVVVQATNGVGSNSSQGIQQCLMQQDSSKLPALTAIQESSYARGRSICLAALNRSEPEAYAHCCEVGGDCWASACLKRATKMDHNALTNVASTCQHCTAKLMPHHLQLGGHQLRCFCNRVLCCLTVYGPAGRLR